ncbi:hypothetical protein [Actinosynnema sp. NPDC020468]|uniref:hypothetical protein n=1 Tax=Actinosynnema sp. NPDC020468 TaxID=3154488 RepID=UPI0033D94499
MDNSAGGRLTFVADTVSSGPAGAGLAAARTRFSVDPDQAQKLIDGLKEALEQVIDFRRNTLVLGQMGSPGNDGYSQTAVESMKTSAGTEEGGYSYAIAKAQDVIESTITQVQDALDQYKNTESAVGDAFKTRG